MTTATNSNVGEPLLKTMWTEGGEGEYGNPKGGPDLPKGGLASPTSNAKKSNTEPGIKSKPKETESNFKDTIADLDSKFEKSSGTANSLATVGMAAAALLGSPPVAAGVAVTYAAFKVTASVVDLLTWDDKKESQETKDKPPSNEAPPETPSPPEKDSPGTSNPDSPGSLSPDNSSAEKNPSGLSDTDSLGSKHDDYGGNADTEGDYDDKDDHAAGAGYF